ncbi:FKBP-type peptidyl-prolyl cis-trans isomerase [Nitrosomonas sp. Nm166]|uniref:FKBP-type peptidyl-prolyl cis-trans isomerase n=1 Tax=Nitrosomonas sp. Nm166 TaxID=1881054 RepID=UPI0008E805EE|nr:FKBP-type peptidyl-prolyl cis-trans isomerase [Nitrosomonas sp. Nm166]SFE90330.1 FKBP-type peptidyl-prolyl cis-trans isomerase FkpA [Nitrosomonas sp. Nm166]
MSNIKNLFNLSILLAFLITTQMAFAYKELAATDGPQFQKIDTVVGTGEEAEIGKTVNVHYTGWLYDENAPDKKGKKFDSSYDRKEYFSFMLGAGRVIKGWDQGVLGMKVGGQRTLIIPSSMAYGARGAGNVIPPNATLIFDVELISLKASSHY